MLDNSPESRTLISACSMVDSVKNELKHVQFFTDDQLTQWHSQNEIRLAQLLLFAEQARLHRDSYDRIKRAVCMLHKPLTGAIEVSASDNERILALLDDIDSNGFCCWMI